MSLLNYKSTRKIGFFFNKYVYENIWFKYLKK